MQTGILEIRCIQENIELCINDGFNVQNEEQVMTEFIKAMEQLFPDKCSFEL